MSALPEASTRETRHRARETKFVTDVALYDQVVSWARQRFGPDGHGAGPHGDQYSTTTLYFETRSFDVYHRRGSYGRSKYRIRRYGAADAVFLERKFRTERLLAKRRTLVPIDALARLSNGTDRTWAGYWFHERIQLRRLQPLLQLSYNRVARVSQGRYGPIRLTIDRNLRALPLADFAFVAPIGMPFLQSACIVEVKYQVELPVLVKEMAATFGLDVQKVSKFRAAIRSLDYPLCPEPDEQVPHRLDCAEHDPAGAYAD
ncbi:MAG: VTC domain-containing protein [Acidobacteria bacterium]|nr:VTC domain-containing protein [Acidobacteriota bacterium]